MATPPDPPPDETVALAALVVLLLSGAPQQQVVNAASGLLLPLGILPGATAAALALLYAHVGKPEVHPPNSAIGQVARTEWVRRASWLVEAGRRITEATPGPPPGTPPGRTPGSPDPGRQAFGQNVRDRIARAVQDPFRQLHDTSPLDAQLAKERRYLEQHLNAVRARREAAARVDAESLRLKSPILGWYAILDSRTTRECALASGKNFEVARPPAIGFPGTPHGGTCRCRPGPLHPGAPMVDSVVRFDQPSPRSGAAAVAV